MKRLTKPGITYNFPKLDIAEIRYLEKIQKRLSSYEDTGLEPEQVMALKSFTQRGIHKVDDGWKHVQDLLQAEQDGRLLELPFVAMVEQTLQDGKMKPMADQKHNGRYAVVYVDHNKWKSPLIDICGKPYNREEAENRMEALAQK